MKITTRKRGKRWNAQAPVYVNGRRRWITATRDRKADAYNAVRDALAEYAQGRGLDRDRSKMTLAAFLDEWLESVRPELRPTTWRGYRNLFDVRVVPRLGATPLRDLDPGAIESLKATLLSEGGRGGDGLAPQSVRNTLRSLGRALGDAERWGWIMRNPVRGVRAPKAGRRPEMCTWAGEQVATFLEATADHPYGIAFAVALGTGLRRGEVLALRWCDVDFDRPHADGRGVLSVRRSLTAAGYDVHEGDPKSGRGRVVTLDERLRERLREHRRHQLEAHLAAGLPRPTLVVTREDGTPLHPQSLSYYFDEAVREVGLPRIRFHDCRHTHATLLLLAGVPAKIVQERLGHSSIAITLDIYSHVTDEMRGAAAAAYAETVYGSRRG